MLFIKNLYQKILFFFLGFTSLLSLGLINLVSLSLLLFLSPVLGLYWLVIGTLYFLFKGNYKKIFIVWGVFFSTWYFFFIICFSDFEFQILIGGEHTAKIMTYLSDKYCNPSCSWYTMLFKGFCLQTVLLFQFLSSKLGFPIYVPSLIKVFISFFKYIFGGDKGSANCAGEENSKKKGASTNESGSIFGSIFKGSAASESKTYDDLEACAVFKKELEKHWSLYPIKSKEGVSGNKYVYYSELWCFGKYTVCGSRNATKEEIQDHKKK